MRCKMKKLRAVMEISFVACGFFLLSDWSSHILYVKVKSKCLQFLDSHSNCHGCKHDGNCMMIGAAGFMFWQEIVHYDVISKIFFCLN